MAAYVPLHTRSQYSILEAAAPIKGLAARAKQENLPALGLTDRGNLYGAVDFYRSCTEYGIKPLIGCELFVAPGSRTEKRRIPGQRVAYPLIVLAMNSTGYRNLCRLSSKGFLEGFYYIPRVDRELLTRYNEGLLVLSGSTEGLLSQLLLQGNPETVAEELRFLQQTFNDRLYIQLSRSPMSPVEQEEDRMGDEPWVLQQLQSAMAQQEQANQRLCELAQAHALPLVATHEVLYLDRPDWRAQEVLLNVLSGEPCEIWERDSQGQPKQLIPNPKRETRASHAHHFLSTEQMVALYADHPGALAQTLEIAERCDLTLDFKTKHYPVFVPPELQKRSFEEEERKEAAAVYLREMCQVAISKKYTGARLQALQEKFPGQDPLDLVQQRLNYELDLIIAKELGDYLLIVFDILDWAKKKGIPVGPGRGSGAGSIICYLLGITEIEPLRFDLFFERFINPERLSYPDIDVDICMARRSEVIDYVVQRYGSENVAQIITFGTIKAKMAVKDVGRVLSIPLTKVNTIAKLIPEDPQITLEGALEQDPDLRQLYETDAETQRIIDLGRKIEGAIRSTGVHAAGIIISGGVTTDFIPICNAKDSDLPVTQYAMKPVEAVGMLKMDLLGLKTLTCIQIACESIQQSHQLTLDWLNLPLDDEKTFALLNQGRTMGIFQLESGGMQDLARQLHLDRFEEIIAVLSLYRPGPMEMIPSFIRRKHGKEPIDYDHPEMEEILKETYGIMVYQEQVMQIAQRLACYSLGEGDVLRRAMGKKDKEEMARQRQKFLTGAQEHGLILETASLIFDKMERFAAYGFNKSHAAAYSMVCYVTAYLKANYPGHWMAALMTCDRDDVTKLAKFIREAQAMQIAVLPPDVNESEAIFMATPKGIRFAMTGIKGVGEGIVDCILAERRKGGPFSSLQECLQRLDLKRVNKKNFELLADAGAFDFTGWSRDALKAFLELQYEASLRQQKDRQAGFMDLFQSQQQGPAAALVAPTVAQPRAPIQLWLREKELLGFFLTGHPMDHYREILQRLSCVALNDVEGLPHQTLFRCAFIIESLETRISAKSGKKFAILQISDGFESYELPIWPELYEQNHDLLSPNRLLYAILQIDHASGESLRLQAKWVADLTQADESMVQACDRAYDKAKNGLRQAEYRNQARAAAPPPVAAPPAAPALLLQVDVRQARLSHVLALKQILHRHRGPSSLEVHFQLDQRCVGQLRIPAKWGVQPSPILIEALLQLPGVFLPQ